MIGWVLDSFVALQMCPIKLINLQMLSNLSKEMTEAKIGIAASSFHDRCNLRLDFCTVPKSMKIAYHQLPLTTWKIHST
jgi:hypothetical protein